MSTADTVAAHIRGSLLDLRRRLDAATAVAISRAVILGAAQALSELSADSPQTAEPLEPLDATADIATMLLGERPKH